MTSTVGRRRIDSLVFFISLAGLVNCALTGNPVIFGLSLFLLIVAGSRRFRDTDKQVGRDAREGTPSSAKRLAGDAGQTSSEDDSNADSSEHVDTSTLVEKLVAQGRYALLTRRQLIGNLTDDQRQRVADQLQQGTALVPAGGVRLAQPDLDAPEQDDAGFSHGKLVEVQSLYLDRFTVTNGQYQHFVDAGGYEDRSLWEPDIWPAVAGFVDQTDHPGPRYWAQGTSLPELVEHPVVGVNWYEAAAYARWVGKRLPTDAEWVRAACSPIAVSEVDYQQRKYPWGESCEKQDANLWGAQIGRTEPVDAYPCSTSVHGIHQMVGNVWEWTTSTYGAWHPKNHQLEAAHPLKSLRGGAFDTYLDGQATCQFQSGDNPLARKHNIGFRCAVSQCDVALESGAETALGTPASRRQGCPEPEEVLA